MTEKRRSQPYPTSNEDLECLVENILSHSSVRRVELKLRKSGITTQIVALDDSARSAKEAADALGIEVGKLHPRLFSACQMTSLF